jgi:hypothetical protein
MTDTKGPEDVLRGNWERASRTTLTAAVVLFLLSRGQKAAPSEIMKMLGLDWSSLNPYAIGLFGVPVLAALCFWTLWWARAFAQSQSSKAWHERVATKTDLSGVGNKAKTLVCWSLVMYVVLPVAGLAGLLGKFLNGAFYFAMTNAYSCLPERAPQDCTPEGSGMAHFWPSHGVQSIWNTPYRYEGNLTYLPPWQAVIWVALCLGVLIYAGLYFRLLLRRAC